VKGAFTDCEATLHTKGVTTVMKTSPQAPVTEFLRKSPWRSRGGAERCVRAVTRAIKRFHARLAGAVDAEGQPHPMLRGFALHLHEYLLVPSGRGGGYARAHATSGSAGSLTYELPPGVIWVG